MLYSALPCPALPCPALPCPALPCPALPCPALPCPALRCSALLCPALLCSALPAPPRPPRPTPPRPTWLPPSVPLSVASPDDVGAVGPGRLCRLCPYHGPLPQALHAALQAANVALLHHGPVSRSTLISLQPVVWIEQLSSFVEYPCKK